jgi:Spy/CpxP family protein refolding chaperone
MNRRTITLTLLAIALIAVPALTVAQARFGGGDGHGPGFFGHRGRHGGDGFGAGMLLGRFADRLELTDDQRAEIEAIVETSREQSQTLREQLAEARQAYRDAHEPGTFDEAEARAHAQSQADLHAEIMVIRMKTKADVYNVLTPEQQEELKEILDLLGDLGPRRGGKRGPGRR